LRFRNYSSSVNSFDFCSPNLHLTYNLWLDGLIILTPLVHFHAIYKYNFQKKKILKTLSSFASIIYFFPYIFRALNRYYLFYNIANIIFFWSSKMFEQSWNMSLNTTKFPKKSKIGKMKKLNTVHLRIFDIGTFKLKLNRPFSLKFG